MSDTLRALVEKYRQYQMTESEQSEQAISFAFGNAHYENENVTREGIARHSLLYQKLGETPGGTTR